MTSWVTRTMSLKYKLKGTDSKHKLYMWDYTKKKNLYILFFKSHSAQSKKSRVIGSSLGSNLN